MGWLDRMLPKVGKEQTVPAPNLTPEDKSPASNPPRCTLAGVPCPECGYDNEANSRFCQECGLALQENRLPAAKQQGELGPPRIAPTLEGPAPPRLGVTIEFPYSTASSFDLAVACAGRVPTFRQTGEGKKAVYQVTFDRRQLEDAMELVEHLKGWRRRVVYLDGQKTLWDNVFTFAWCYERKKASYKPQFYCFGYEEDWQLNLWGCIHAGMPFVESADWFCYGRWLDKSGDWEFDKARMRHELERALFKYQHCPALDLGRVEEVLTALPDKVNPTKSRDWQFVEAWEPGAEGLTIVTERYGSKTKIVMKGVSPKGKGSMGDIARQLKLRLPG